MKKKVVMISGGGLVLVAGAAFLLVGMAGVPKQDHSLEALRGTEAYYTGSEIEQDLPDCLGNLKGQQAQRILKVGLTVVYRLGPELKEAASLFSSRKAAIMDCLHRIFGAKTLEDVEGAERKELIKEEIRIQLQTILFPDKKGRIERVLYRDFFVQ